MDLAMLRDLSTVVLMIVFIGVCVWAYSKKRKQRFTEAANLPFADEEIARRSSAANEGVEK